MLYCVCFKYKYIQSADGGSNHCQLEYMIHNINNPRVQHGCVQHGALRRGAGIDKTYWLVYISQHLQYILCLHNILLYMFWIVHSMRWLLTCVGSSLESLLNNKYGWAVYLHPSSYYSHITGVMDAVMGKEIKFPSIKIWNAPMSAQAFAYKWWLPRNITQRRMMFPAISVWIIPGFTPHWPHRPT